MMDRYGDDLETPSIRAAVLDLQAYRARRGERPTSPEPGVAACDVVSLRQSAATASVISADGTGGMDADAYVASPRAPGAETRQEWLGVDGPANPLHAPAHGGDHQEA